MTYKKLILESITVVSLFVIQVVILYTFIKCNENNKEVKIPRREERIDSIIEITSKLKIDIEYLDTKKNEEISEVLTLDNDSTLKLFFKLVSE